MEQHDVTLNAGHGGKDSGAVNSKVKEKDINLKVTLYAKAYLESKGVKVNLTRSTDKYDSLNAIVKKCNAFGSELVVSIHHNAGGGDGSEVIHSVYHGEGLLFAKELAKQFEGIGQNTHGVGVRDKYASSGQGDYFTVIGGTTMPCVISEFGFMDTRDYEAFDTECELKGEGEAIGKAICNYFGVSLSEPIISKPIVEPKSNPYTIKYLQHELNIQYNARLNEDNIAGKLTLAECPTVRVHARGNIVRFIQHILGVHVDGIFGTNTLYRLVVFQKEHRLGRDGIVGHNTWKAILKV